MNNLSLTYSQLMNAATKHRRKLFSISQSNKILLDVLNNGEFLKNDFLKTLTDYPKYPNLFPVINNLKDYNLLKIYNISSDDTSYLLEAITEQYIRNLKRRYDKIPEKDILQDISLQNSFFTSTNDLMSLSFFNNLYADTKIQDYVFNLFDGEYSESLKTTSVIYLIFLKFLLKKNVPLLSDTSQKVTDYVISQNTLTNTLIKSSFSTFITKNKTSITKDIVRFIFNYCYEITYFSDSFLDSVSSNVENVVDNISSIFESFIDKKDNILDKIIINSLETLYGYLSTDLVSQIFSSSTLINQNHISDISLNFECEKFNNFYLTHNETLIKQYLLLSYYYKFWPKKFLNILQLIIKEYVNNVIKSSNNQAISLTDLFSQLKTLTETLNWEELDTILTSTLTSQYMANINDKKYISTYSAIEHFSSLFDEFLDTDLNSEFDNYINTIFDSVFSYLKNSGLIKYNVDYYNNRNMLLVYLKTYFRFNIFKYGIIEETQTSTSEYKIKLNSDIYSVKGVWLNSDTTYQKNYFDGGSYLNDEITLVTALPTNNQEVKVQYYPNSLFIEYISQLKSQINYVLNNNITIAIDGNKIKQQTTEFMNIDINNISQFIENIFSSALSKKIILENLSFFIN